MLIENGFEVAASPEAAWSLLVDVPRIVPCMPGATLEKTVDESTWVVLQQVKLGPISLRFRSEVRRTELDPAARRATLAVKAREVRGRGGAEATIRSALSTVDGGTRVDISTELTLQGAVAQYGRPVVGSVAEELTRQFSECLARQLRSEDGAGAGASSPAAEQEPTRPVGGLRLGLRAIWASLTRPFRRP